MGNPASDQTLGSIQLRVHFLALAAKLLVSTNIECEPDAPAGLNLYGVAFAADKPDGVAVALCLDPQSMEALDAEVDHQTRSVTFFGGETPLDDRIADYREERILGAKHTLHAGTLTRRGEPIADFVAMVDPLPIVLVGLSVMVGAYPACRNGRACG